MPSEVITNLTPQVARATTVVKSATILVKGIKDRIAAAVQEALANGATPEELAPLVSLGNELNTETDALAAAVLEHTGASA